MNYLENLIYYLIENLKNSKKILNNYYLRNADKLRFEWLEDNFKKRVKDKKKNDISKLLLKKEILASLINNKKISDWE